MSSAGRLKLQRILALADKEVRHVVRDPRTLVLALAMPVVMLLLFGFGVSFDLDHLPLAFIDRDQSAMSRTLRRRLTAGDLFDDAGAFASAAEVQGAMVQGRALAAVVIERDFARHLVRGQSARVQLLIDGSDNNTAVQVRARAEAALRAIARSDPDRPQYTKSPPLELRTFSRFNPEERSAVYLVPGIAAFVLAMVAVLLTALTVAREWEQGSMAQLFATPVGRLEIVVGKLLPYLVLGALAVLLVVAVGGLVFDVPLRGSLWALGVLSLLFLLGMLGQGLLISVLTRNQMVATQIGAMSSMLPSVLLSGFVFPIEDMPMPIQWVTWLIPARYFIAGLRGVMLRGNGLAELWLNALMLALFGLGMLTLCTLRFRRTIA